jgi:hypothetical protein
VRAQQLFVAGQRGIDIAEDSVETAGDELVFDGIQAPGMLRVIRPGVVTSTV